MRFISGNCLDETGQFLGKWWEENTGSKLTFPYAAFGAHNGTQLLGVVILANYNGSNIEAHIYAPRAVNRETIPVFLDYIFNQLGCNVLRATIITTNKKAIKFIEKFGFEQECLLESYFGPKVEEWAYLFKYTREKASKWITLDNGRTESSNTG